MIKAEQDTSIPDIPGKTEVITDKMLEVRLLYKKLEGGFKL